MSMSLCQNMYYMKTCIIIRWSYFVLLTCLIICNISHWNEVELDIRSSIKRERSSKVPVLLSFVSRNLFSAMFKSSLWILGLSMPVCHTHTILRHRVVSSTYDLRRNHLQDEQLHFIVLLLLQGGNWTFPALVHVTPMFHLAKCHFECVCGGVVVCTAPQPCLLTP